MKANQRLAAWLAWSIFVACFVAVAATLPAHSGWLSSISRGAAEIGAAGAKAARLGIPSLERAAAIIREVPPATKNVPLAAHLTPEGHWKFVNRSGEVFTAGTPDELARAIPTLVPELAQGEAVAMYLTEQTVFETRSGLKSLPKASELNVVVGNDPFRLIRNQAGQTEVLYAEVRPNIIVELAERSLFDEAVWQLTRPLRKADIRVVSLQPGGPERLSSVPKYDPQTRAAVVDAINPYRLPAALSSLRGQTVLVTGRLEGDVLHFTPPKGADGMVVLKDLAAAAELADVNLVVLEQSAGRQPGGRNWLWQRVEVKGLDDALSRASFADFLNALAASRGQLAVSASAESSGRVRIRAVPSGAAATPVGGGLADWIGGFASDITGQMTGHVLTTAVHANLRSADRQKELDARLIPGVPSWLQMGYLGGMVCGVLGWATLAGWWRRLWPEEKRSEYEGASGYNLARAVRLLVFALVFLPLAGPLAFTAAIALQIWELVTAPFRLVRRLWQRLAGANSP